MKRSIIATILAATLLVSMAGMVSASNDWNLDSNGVMYENDNPNGGEVFINDSYIWRADQHAPHAFQFGDAVWYGNLETNYSGYVTDINIGWCDYNRSNFNPAENTIVDLRYEEQTIYFGIVGSFEVPEGMYVALQVNSSDITVTTANGSSKLIYPGQPAYPAPEFATIALVGIGLIGLVALGRRRT